MEQTNGSSAPGGHQDPRGNQEVSVHEEKAYWHAHSLLLAKEVAGAEKTTIIPD